MHDNDFIRGAEELEATEVWDQTGWEQVIFELEEWLEDFGSEG